MNALLAKLDPAAESAMRQMISGALRTQAVYAIAKLGVPDQLALGARDADDLAQRTGAHAPTLRRILRYLATCGVVLEHADHRFSLTAAGEFLQSAHPRSLGPSAIRAGEGLWQTTAALYEAARTGNTPYEIVHGAPFFERMSDREKDAEFASRMSSSTAGLADAIAAHPAVAGARTIVDAGGGNGSLLLAILERLPQLRGTLVERDPMIAAARPLVAQSSAADRCDLIAGDFFTSIPAADVALLSWVLHDWNDGDALRILRACRAPALLIVEVLMPEVAHPGDFTGVLADPFSLDLQMLLLTGGRERTLDEYRRLLEEAGYALKKTTPLPSRRGASLIAAYRTAADYE